MKTLAVLTLCGIATSLLFAENLVREQSADAWHPKVEAVGSSLVASQQKQYLLLKEFIPVFPGKKYRLSGKFKSVTPDNLSVFVYGLRMADDNKNIIWRQNVAAKDGSSTELSKDAAKGATSVFVKDASGWEKRRSSKTSIAFHVKDDFSDLPNREITDVVRVLKQEDGFEIKLGKPLANDFPAGTMVRQHFNGSYQHCAANYVKAPVDWKTFSADLEGISLNDSPMDKFWPGTKFVQVFIAVNLGAPDAKIMFEDIKFEEVK